MNIRLVIAKDWPKGDFECDDDTKDENYLIEKYVKDNANNTKELEKAGLHVEDFTVPDNLDSQLILDICAGKSFGKWIEYGTEFYNDYYQNWIFAEKEGKYSDFILITPK